jgi:putative restriction endonuclease
MAKGVLTTKADSQYDDVREERYHFPQNYLSRLQRMIGDLIVYYEPRRAGGRSAYIAVAQVERIDADPGVDRHHYARISNYIEFDRPVPFREQGVLFESGLQSEGETGLSGEFRNAVRLIPEHEFEAILAAGFSEGILPQAYATHTTGLNDPDREFRRPIVEQIVRRPFRDAAFARQVKGAYSGRCAFTGLEMRNGGGRTEVDAAHIKPVGDGHSGPDSVRNGLALSKTVHWMFDRGLLSIDSDFKILMARNLVPEPIKRLIIPEGTMLLPERSIDRPHPAFLEYHRNRIFKDATAGA